VFFGVNVILRHGDHFIHREPGSADDDAGHQLGKRCNWKHRMFILAEQHFTRVLVNHQGHAGLQIQRVDRAVQASHLAKRRNGGNQGLNKGRPLGTGYLGAGFKAYILANGCYFLGRFRFFDMGLLDNRSLGRRFFRCSMGSRCYQSKRQSKESHDF